MIKSQALGGRSNKALIFLGLFLGLVSAVLVVVYLSSAGGDGGGDASSVATTPVVVASQEIAVGTRITEEMVTLKPISTDAVLAGAFVNTGGVVGKVARVPLVVGEQVIPTKVAAIGTAIDLEDPPLAYVIPEGKRAVAVRVSSVIGASGLIRPGDFVDVILTVRIESSAGDVDGGSGGGESVITLATGGDEIARTVLQNALVLSVDQEVARTVVDGSEEGAPVVGEGGESDLEPTTVTLAVSPVEGEVLTVAETCGENFSGRLTLALRPFGDSSQVVTRSVWAEDGPPPTCAALMGLTTVQ